jgi:hypothetical protein
MLLLVEDALETPAPHVTNWVNGNLYIPTSEACGVLPIPEGIRISTEMGSYESKLHAKEKHHHLAQLQGTRKAVLPISSAAERAKFLTMMRDHPAFNSPSGPRWQDAAKVWNQHANEEKELFYKVRTSCYTQCVLIKVSAH